MEVKLTFLEEPTDIILREVVSTSYDYDEGCELRIGFMNSKGQTYLYYLKDIKSIDIGELNER